MLWVNVLRPSIGMQNFEQEKTRTPATGMFKQSCLLTQKWWLPNYKQCYTRHLGFDPVLPLRVFPWRSAEPNVFVWFLFSQLSICWTVNYIMPIPRDIVFHNLTFTIYTQIKLVLSCRAPGSNLSFLMACTIVTWFRRWEPLNQGEIDCLNFQGRQGSKTSCVHTTVIWSIALEGKGNWGKTS